MFKYEIPVSENAHNYTARELYLEEKKRLNEAQKVKREYAEFVKNSRDYLLSECINMILQESLNEDTLQEDRDYGKALVEGFVQENDSAKLLGEFSRKSLFLANIAEAVNETHKKVIHSCKEGDNKTFKINKTVKDEFFSKMVGLSDKKITEKINERVCDSLENFVQAQVNDKLDMEELAEKTKEKIDNIKANSVQQRDAMVQEFTNYFNRESQKIKNRSNRKISLYEQLKYGTTENIVKDQSVLESFTNESGQLDMDKINRKVDVMYTFLEMLNTAKIVNVNEAYVQNILKNM